MATKKTRKELLKQEDAFLAAAQQGARWAQSNKTALVAGSIAAVVLINAIWGGAEFIRLRNLEASRQIEEALALSRAEVVGEGADPTADPPTFGTEGHKQQAVLEKMEQVVEASGGRGAGVLARLAIADLHEQMGNYEAAEKEFAALVDDLSTRDALYFLAVERTAFLQERRGDRDAALKTFGRLAGREDAFYGAAATYHQARLHHAKGEHDEARRLYEQVKESLDIPALKTELERRLEQVSGGAHAETGEVGAATAPNAAGSTEGAATAMEAGAR